MATDPQHDVALATTWEPNAGATTVRPECTCRWVGQNHRSSKSEDIARRMAEAEHRAHIRTVTRSTS